jgi:phosphatidylglycerophosphatase A
MKHWKQWYTSCFGMGFLPWAPGSWGSIPSTLLFGLLCVAQTPPWIVAMILVAASVVCVRFAPDVITVAGDEDPGQIVCDEVAGQAITFLALPAITDGMTILWIMGSGFFMYRLFDTLKLPPARQLEKLPKGWGILCDDLAAGVQAMIALQFLARFWLLK